MTIAVCNGTHGDDARARTLARRAGAAYLEVEWHRFPDGETGVRVPGPVPARVAVFADLDRPDPKFLPLVFLLDALRDLGAEHVTLVAPYLPYLRQDARFRDGEAITSRTFAAALSPLVDRIVTVDPHLHRYRSLEEIYAAEGVVLSAAETIGRWTGAHVDSPVLIGPDTESRQWVERAAAAADTSFMVLEKKRRGDRDVSIRVGELDMLAGRTPVLVDDIISSGHTMAETVRGLLARGMKSPVCIGVHAVFADGAGRLLADAGAARVVTSNTIAHPSNGIDVFGLLADALRA